MISNPIQSIKATRKLASDILAESLNDINGLSEIGIKDKILTEMQKHNQLFPEGWYNPPPSGIVVLLGKKPFSRFLYQTLRNNDYWPNQKFLLEQETVGFVYISPVNKKNGMLGDIGFTFYNGADEKIKAHLKNCFSVILKIAQFVQVGMKFSEICSFASGIYKNKFKPTYWLTTNSDPNHLLNLGHTVPVSFEKNFNFINSFEKIKEDIKTKRIYINDNENFVIPKTCALTIESRIEDYNDPALPSTFFHFIVCFDQGKKTILNNFDKIFKVMNMDYILK